MPSPLLDVATRVPRVQIMYDFVTRAEEAFLVKHINQVGGDHTQGHKNWGWKELNGRRSMAWGGTILPNSHALVPAPFPKFMDGDWPDLVDRIAQTGVYDAWTDNATGTGRERGPNHCLVNEYLPAQGILPHTDGPAYVACTTTLSLASHTVLSLRSNPAAAERVVVDKIDIFLPPRSLVVLTDELYSTWLHGIQPLATSPAESLTRCANWDQWWTYLEERGPELGTEGPGTVDDEEIFHRGDDAGQGRSERDRAFEELKHGLKQLDLLSPSSPGADDDGVDDPPVVDWVKRVGDARRRIEVEGWARSKRVSLTCRRARGKVRDLGGLLSKVTRGGSGANSKK
ncbi:hypothetical protein JCM11491_000038 [Sporobolomyces phaffii]